jgi:tetratricopeptide (TPR) repeat protein
LAGVFFLSGFSVLLAAQDKSKADKTPPKTAQQPQEQEPPEEDESLKPKEYAFNPLQASKELSAGNYYFKKGSFRAARGRFLEATRWNPGFAEAYLRLAEAQEKLKDGQGAKQAYEKYIELAPDAKNVDAIRKKVKKIKN